MSLAMLKICRSSLILWEKLSRCPWPERWDQAMRYFSPLAGGIVCEVNLQAFHFRCGFSVYGSCEKPRAVIHTFVIYRTFLPEPHSCDGGVIPPPVLGNRFSQNIPRSEAIFLNYDHQLTMKYYNHTTRHCMCLNARP